MAAIRVEPGFLGRPTRARHRVRSSRRKLRGYRLDRRIDAIRTSCLDTKDGTVTLPSLAADGQVVWAGEWIDTLERLKKGNS